VRWRSKKIPAVQHLNDSSPEPKVNLPAVPKPNDSGTALARGKLKEYRFRTACIKRPEALQAAEKLALFEGYGLQAVHNRCVMNPALAAESCYSYRNHPFSAACLAARNEGRS